MATRTLEDQNYGPGTPAWEAYWSAVGETDYPHVQPRPREVAAGYLALVALQVQAPESALAE